MKGMLTGRAGRGGVPTRGNKCRGGACLDGGKRRKGAVAEKSETEQGVPGRARLCEAAGVGSVACATVGKGILKDRL